MDKLRGLGPLDSLATRFHRKSRILNWIFRRRLAAENQVTSLSQIPLQKPRDANLVSWPPLPEAVPICSVLDLMKANAELIRGIVLTSTLTDVEVEAFLVPMFANLARTVQQLPASEYEHHQGLGGLYTHSLEVAFFCANHLKQTSIPFAVTPRQIESNLKRWIFSGIVAGLAHDIGKPYTDMTIALPTGEAWQGDQLLQDWLMKTGADSYYIAFKPDRVHNAHCRASLAKLEGFMPQRAKLFLARGGFGSELLAGIQKAILGETDNNLLGRILMQADSLSVRKDKERQRAIPPNYKNVSHPQANLALQVIRRLIEDGTWTVNVDEKSRVWVTDQGTFIEWASAPGEIVRAAGSMGIKGIPSDATALAQVLVSSRAATAYRTADSGLDAVVWPITPFILKDKKLLAVRMADPQIIFNSVPNPPMPVVVYGRPISRETQMRWAQKWQFTPADTIDGESAGYSRELIAEQRSRKLVVEYDDGGELVGVTSVGEVDPDMEASLMADAGGTGTIPAPEGYAGFEPVEQTALRPKAEAAVAAAAPAEAKDAEEGSEETDEAVRARMAAARRSIADGSGAAFNIAAVMPRVGAASETAPAPSSTTDESARPEETEPSAAAIPHEGEKVSGRLRQNPMPDPATTPTSVPDPSSAADDIQNANRDSIPEPDAGSEGFDEIPDPDTGFGNVEDYGVQGFEDDVPAAAADPDVVGPSVEDPPVVPSAQETPAVCVPGHAPETSALAGKDNPPDELQGVNGVPADVIDALAGKLLPGAGRAAGADMEDGIEKVSSVTENRGSGFSMETILPRSIRREPFKSHEQRSKSEEQTSVPGRQNEGADCAGNSADQGKAKIPPVAAKAKAARSDRGPSDANTPEKVSEKVAVKPQADPGKQSELSRATKENGDGGKGGKDAKGGKRGKGKVAPAADPASASGPANPEESSESRCRERAEGTASRSSVDIVDKADTPSGKPAGTLNIAHADVRAQPEKSSAARVIVVENDAAKGGESVPVKAGSVPSAAARAMLPTTCAPAAAVRRPRPPGPAPFPDEVEEGVDKPIDRRAKKTPAVGRAAGIRAAHAPVVPVEQYDLFGEAGDPEPVAGSGKRSTESRSAKGTADAAGASGMSDNAGASASRNPKKVPAARTTGGRPAHRTTLVLESRLRRMIRQMRSGTGSYLAGPVVAEVSSGRLTASARLLIEACSEAGFDEATVALIAVNVVDDEGWGIRIDRARCLAELIPPGSAEN